MTTILDGSKLAQERAPLLAARAAAVRTRRGRAPRLALVAFGDNQRAPHIDRKIGACATVGVECVAHILPVETSTEEALASIHDLLATAHLDGLFLQFPFPSHIDESALAAAIPYAVDVDVMRDDRFHGYVALEDALPPVTVSAALALLDDYDIEVSGQTGVVIAEASPFAEMFREAFARRGARMQPLVAPRDPARGEILARSQVAIIAAAEPGIVPASEFARDAVAIDVGYFNPGARGDIDTSSGIEHLRAIVPVPGGIGPMTVSMLIERVILFAELDDGQRTQSQAGKMIQPRPNEPDNWMPDPTVRTTSATDLQSLLEAIVRRYKLVGAVVATRAGVVRARVGGSLEDATDGFQAAIAGDAGSLSSLADAIDGKTLPRYFSQGMLDAYADIPQPGLVALFMRARTSADASELQRVSDYNVAKEMTAELREGMGRIG